MTDTKAPTPWLEVVKGLMPSLNTCLVAIVTAAVTWFGTTRLASPPPAPAPHIVEVVKTIPSATDQRLSAMEAKIDKLVEAHAQHKAKRKTATVK